jgi:hypothetical protein
MVNSGLNLRRRGRTVTQGVARVAYLIGAFRSVTKSHYALEMQTRALAAPVKAARKVYQAQISHFPP